MTDEKIVSRPELENDILSDTYRSSVLVLHNDDYNTFDYVIAALVEVCEHDKEQAAQCALITHYKGRCDVKIDSYDRLKPKKNALIDRGLNCTIEDYKV